MQQVLSKIKASLEESRKRIESGNHESHDLLPSLLLILVELLEQNSEKYEKFLIKQENLLAEDEIKRKNNYTSLVEDAIETRWILEDLNEKFLNKLEWVLKEENSQRQDDYGNLVKNTNDTKRDTQDINSDFLHKMEESFIWFQNQFLIKNKTTNTIIYILLWLSLISNIGLFILFIVK